jgi:hypothetical protein
MEGTDHGLTRMIKQAMGKPSEANRSQDGDGVRSLYTISILLLTTSLARPTHRQCNNNREKDKQNLTFSLFFFFFGPFTDSHIIPPTPRFSVGYGKNPPATCGK